MKTILWNQQVQTERTISYKKPDIIIRDNEKGICVIEDVAFREKELWLRKKSEKFLKYKNLTKTHE